MKRTPIEPTAPAKTRSQVVADDVAALLRARNPLLWITTGEEARVEQYLFEAAAAANYVTYTWDVAQGAMTAAGTPERNIGGTDPADMLAAIAARATANMGGERSVWIMRDLPQWLDGMPGATVLRGLRNLVRILPTVPRDRAQAIIVLSASGKVPPELTTVATAIEWPLPDRAEIAEILTAAVEALPDEMQEKALSNGSREAAIDAAVGLSADEASACYAKSLVQSRMIVPGAVSAEKKRVITREKILDWHDPLPGGLEAVGGMQNLKDWLTSRAAAYSASARAYGLPAPRGTLLLGPPGTGKSLTCKAIATAWGVPLLRLDLGALKSKYVGDSEANIRRAFRVIEAIGRCVVWIDEIEKAMQGATSGSSDGGVSADALGAVLSWMQERQGEAFIVATSNDVSQLPPELLRAGRFDQVWFIDLPDETERVSIMKAALRMFNPPAEGIDFKKLVPGTAKFTGAEIAAMIPDAMFEAFADGERPITTKDLLAAAERITPLADTAAEKIAALRQWAKGRTRPASATQQVTGEKGGSRRALDL